MGTGPTAWLCQIDAFARDDGAATTIRLASHDDDRLCHLDDETWWPSIARLPAFSYDFFDGAFGGEIAAPSGKADLSISAIPDFATLMFHGARIQWWSGTLGDAWGSYTQRFDGVIDNHPAIRDGIAAQEFRVDDRWLDDPILSTYSGAGDAEGESAMKGQVKPLLLGAPRMVEGVLVDPIDTIVQLNDGPIEGVEVAFENVQRFDALVGDHASFAALDAATIAPGKVASALAVGMVRHGAPSERVLTYDVKGSNSGSDGGGWVRKPGALIKRLAAHAGKLAKVDTASLDALDVARPWNISIALTQQTTMREVVQSIAQSVNAVALVTWLGKLIVLPIPLPETATPVGTLAADGSALPPVASVAQLGVAAPWWRLAIEAEVTQRVHGNDEVAYYDVPVIEKTVYKRAASAPATPSGGYFNYLTQETTPPTGWSASVPAGSNPVYASTAVASRSPEAGNAPFGNWSAPVIAFQDGATGAPGSPGTPGADAIQIFVASTHQTFRYDATGAPISQTTTITATRQNTAGTTEWQVAKADGTALTGWLTAAAMVSAGGADSSPNNDTLVLNQERFNTIITTDPTSGLIYLARISSTTTIQDRISIVKVQDGADGSDGADGDDGADGTNGLSIAATKPIVTVARTGSGTVKAGELPKSTQMIVYDGFTDITASCTYSRTTSNCSVSNDGGGGFTLTAVTDPAAYFDVTATAGDGRSITMRIPTSQAADGPAASRASNALSTMTTSGGFVSVGSVDIVAAAGTTISGAGSTTYQATNTGAGTRTVRAEAKISIQNLTDSGAESDGSSVIGSAASYIAGDGPSDIGSVSAGHSVTNSTGAPKTFRVRLYVRKYDGLANINTTGGTYAGTVAAEVA